MPNQQQLLSILLDKQRQLKDKQRQIYQLKKKISNIDKYTSRIRVLQEKVYKLERIIKKLQNRPQHGIEPNTISVGQGDRNQKANIKQQIKEIDSKFNRLKENKNPTNQGIKNQNLVNLINNRFKLDLAVTKNDSYHLQSYNCKGHCAKVQKKSQKYLIAAIGKSGHSETERIVGAKGSQSFGFNQPVKEKGLNSSGYLLREKHSYRAPKSNRNYLSEVSFESSSISGIERQSFNNTANIDESSSLLYEKQRKKVQFEGCMDLQRYKKQRLKNSNNTSQFMKINKCYSGYSTPTSQEKSKNQNGIPVSIKGRKQGQQWKGKKQNIGEQLCKQLKLKTKGRK